MLLKVTSSPGTPPTYENMHVGRVAAMCLFTTALTLPSAESAGTVTITYARPATSPRTTDPDPDTLTIPLQPSITHLSPLAINMHQSQSGAHAMPDDTSAWFSRRFGFDVVLAYLGEHRRPVLGNLAPNAAVRNARRRVEVEAEEETASSWLGGLVGRVQAQLPLVLGGSGAADGGEAEDEEDYGITFADCSPYLVVSAASLADVSARLPPAAPAMDVTKFRPNIVVTGAREAWTEDFWRELSITSASNSAGIRLRLTSNCVRCQSINVDYGTGRFDTGPAVLKELAKDRRVDVGHKYNPVFGRYGFVERGCEGWGVEVGDEVEVVARNEAHTVFRWPGIGQTPKTELYPVE